MRKLLITEISRLTVEQFKAAPKNSTVAVLDNIRSLHNVGSVFRTADAFCLESVYLCGITATPPHNEIHKSALGAEDAVNWSYFKHTETAILQLKQQGYKVLAIEQTDGSNMLPAFRFEPEQKYAAVFGNEVKGVQQSVIDLCDAAIEIPQFGTKHSLNVSVSAGIVLWEIVRQTV